jgi:hypothetical protein
MRFAPAPANIHRASGAEEFASGIIMRLTIKHVLIVAIFVTAAFAVSLLAIRLGFYARRDAALTSPVPSEAHSSNQTP